MRNGGKSWQFKKGKQPPSHKLECKCFRCSKIPWNKGIKGLVKQSKETIAKRVVKLKGHRPFKLAKINAYEIRLQKQNIYTHKRRALKMKSGGSHTSDEWENLKRIYQYICACCKKQEPEIKLTKDHIIPISKGGSDAIENIQPLCMRCNHMKFIDTTNYLTNNINKADAVETIRKEELRNVI